MQGSGSIFLSYGSLRSKYSPHLSPLHSEIFRLCWLRRTTDIQNRILANWVVRLSSVAEKTLCSIVHHFNSLATFTDVIKGLAPLAIAIHPSLTPSTKIGWENPKIKALKTLILLFFIPFIPLLNWDKVL